MKSHRKLSFCIVAGASMFFVSVAGMILLAIPAFQGQAAKLQPVTKGISVAATVAPFLHRPYYGDQTILQRTISFFDHDDPWYVYDGRFVRFDGASWTGTSVGSCIGGTNCYDGHNGYDLNLRFEPVLSAAAGTVIRANWYNPLNHNDAFGLWVAVDHGNGYVTAYGHLSMITVAVGDHIGTQWQIGASGTTGSSTGPHLHMSVYYLPNWQVTDPFGWRGNYPDPNAVPDRYLWVSQPNAPYNIPPLGGSAAYSGAILVDDSDRGWSATGSWASSASGSDVGGSMHWATTVSSGAGATATWHPAIPADGYYEIGVYIDDNHASSSWAPYTVYSADPTRNGVEVQHSVYVDQSHVGLFQGPFGTVNTGTQWMSLGTYYFRASMNGRVVLNSATGISGEQLGADGMEFVSVGSNLTDFSSSVAPSAGTLTTIATHASRQYYFAEGYTGAGTSEQLALTNLAASPATITATYYYPNAASQVRTYRLAAFAHRSVSINREVGENLSVSVLVRGDQSFLAERIMRMRKDGFVAVTHSQGVIAPSRAWYFAEGNTTPGWNTLLSALNPGIQPVALTVHYLLTPGAAPAKRESVYTLPPQSRSTIVLNDEQPKRQFGMVITASGDVVVERAEYLVQSPWQGGSAMPGVTAPQKTWYFATGNTTGGCIETLVLSNPAARAVRVHIRYLLAGGMIDTQNVRVPGQSRLEVPVNAVVRGAIHATLINAEGEIVAERQDFFTVNAGSRLIKGSRTVMGSSRAEATWYVPQMTEEAQGALTLTNLNATPVQVGVVFYREAGGPLLKRYTLAAHQSQTIRSANLVAAQQGFGLVITAGSPVVVEYSASSSGL